MNPEKARELFSDYREGVLSPSLKTSFESILASDSVVKREFEQFNELLSEFEKSSEHTVVVPVDLHDKIMARIDKSLFDERRKAKAGWFSGRRLGFVSALACIAILSTIFSIKNNERNGPSTSGIGADYGGVGLSVSTEGGRLFVRHGTASGSSVLVKDEQTGKLVQRFDLNGNALNSLQQNRGEEAVLLRIESNLESLVVAVPGKNRKTVLEGRGTFKDLARIAADTYGIPVQVGASDQEVQLNWLLDSSEPMRSKATTGRFSLERRNGMLYLTD